MERFDLTQEVQVINLLKERFFINHRMSPDLFKFDIRRVRDFSDNATEWMLFEMEKGVAYEKKEDVCEAEFPETLWQFIKEFYLPKFFKRMFPVRYAKLRVKVDLKVKYLDVPVFLQDRSPRIQITGLEMLPTAYNFTKREDKEDGIETD